MAATDDWVVWQDPPAVTPSRRYQVASTLRSRPRQWARIAHVDGVALFPWWAPICNSPDFECRFVPLNPDTPLFGPRDLYARFVGKVSAATDTCTCGLCDVTPPGGPPEFMRGRPNGCSQHGGRQVAAAMDQARRSDP